VERSFQHPLSGMANGGNDVFEQDSVASAAPPPPLPIATNCGMTH